MLHENMMHLLPRVFNENLNNEKRIIQLKEYGGEKMEGRVFDGIVYASVAKVRSL